MEIDSEVLPKHGQEVEYYFEPFGKWYIGTFYFPEGYEDDKSYEGIGYCCSVVGKSGFSSWLPEVTKWRVVK